MSARITCLVGQRGTGKTSLLRRIARYQPQAAIFDLDAATQKFTGQTTTQLFADAGEREFRRIENLVWLDLLRDARTRRDAGQDVLLALGAGFRPEHGYPHDLRILWVRRGDESLGRIFLDRPRLEPTLSPLQEFTARAAPREIFFRAHAHECLSLREGATDYDAGEDAYFNHGFRDLGGVYTVTRDPCTDDAREVLARRLRWGVALFELRDDWLSPEAIARCRALLPAHQILRSFRGGQKSAPDLRAGEQWDWDLSLGPRPQTLPSERGTLSLHPAQSSDVGSELLRLQNAARTFEVSRVKFAPILTDFAQLAPLEEWRAALPAHRAILPISPPHAPEARWTWYRQLRAHDMALNFWRDGDDPRTPADQPTLLEWAAARRNLSVHHPQFAAVLGWPATHSRTPVEHEAFFAARRRAVLAVPLRAEEMPTALPQLRALGMRQAAVTSPLKEVARQLAWAPPCSLRALNTLQWDYSRKIFVGTNTDEEGLRELVAGIRGLGHHDFEVAVWGGGGTLEVLQRVLPAHASFYSARTGQLRQGRPAQNPAVLVWAAGAQSAPLPPSWRPHYLLDLSYRDDSPAREVAQSLRARGHTLEYRDGSAMFARQARAQRRFWAQHEPGQ